jgi:hypothetical protein
MKSFVKLAVLGAAAAALSPAAFAQADNTNSKTSPTAAFGGWMTDWSRSNSGRISRDAYMREQERRWDLADRERRGLTVDEINRAYGYTWSTPTPMGSNANPGNMGPGNVKK